MNNELYKYVDEIQFKWRAEEEVKYTVKQEGHFAVPGKDLGC